MHIFYGEEQARRHKASASKVQDQGWTFLLGIICWFSRRSLKPAVSTKGSRGKWNIKKEGKKTYKKIPRKNILRADRNIWGVKHCQVSQLAKLCVHELGRATSSSCTEIFSHVLKDPSLFKMSRVESKENPSCQNVINYYLAGDRWSSDKCRHLAFCLNRVCKVKWVDSLSRTSWPPINRGAKRIRNPFQSLWEDFLSSVSYSAGAICHTYLQNTFAASRYYIFRLGCDP